MESEFKEKQKFTQWWLWLFLIGFGLFQVYGLFKQLIIGEDFGDKPMSDIGLIIFTIASVWNHIFVLVYETRNRN